LRDQVFTGNAPFTKRFALQEEGTDLPSDRDRFYSTGRKIFSYSGRINDPTPDFIHRYHQQDLPTAVQQGLASSGDQFFVLGGGNLDFCLFKTFRSLVEVKKGQQEPLFAAIATANVYPSDQINDVFAYFQDRNNHYARFLRQATAAGTLPGYRLYYDGRIIESVGPSSSVELHWFSSLQAMFSSPVFFPELSGTEPQRLIREHFNYQTPLSS
jgi:hypothetical protein